MKGYKVPGIVSLLKQIVNQLLKIMESKDIHQGFALLYKAQEIFLHGFYNPLISNIEVYAVLGVGIDGSGFQCSKVSGYGNSISEDTLHLLRVVICLDLT